MSNWEEVTLDKLGKIIGGRQTHYPKDDPILFWRGNIPFIETQNIKESLLFVKKVSKYYNEKGKEQGKLFDFNTVCISAVGKNIANSALLKSPSCLSANIHGFKAYEGIACPKFIKYCFDFPPIKKECISLSQSSTAQPFLTSKSLLGVKFPNPSFQTQKNIGDILSAYDELIENHEKQIEILEQLRTDLYKEWFINLRFPNYEKHLIKDGLPKGWRDVKLKDIATIQKGKKSAGYASPNGAYPFFTASFETKKSNGFSYDSFSLIIAEGGEFHIKIYNGKFEASDHTYIINFENLDYIFLVCEALDVNYINFLNKTIVGTAIKNLPISKVKELSILLPEKELVKKFNIFCGDIQTKIEKLDAKMRKN